MAYPRNRYRPVRRRSGIPRGRRDNRGDSLTGIMLVQVVITLCLVSGLYFATLGSGQLALSVRQGAEALIGRTWDEGEIRAAMGRVASLTPIQGGWSWEGVGGLYGNQPEDAYLGEAVLAGTQPQSNRIEGEELPMPPLPVLEQRPAPSGPLPSVGDSPLPTVPIEEAVPDNEPTADVDAAVSSEGVLKPPVNTAADEDDHTTADKAGAVAPALSGPTRKITPNTGSQAMDLPQGVLFSPVYLSVRLASPAAGRVTSQFGMRTHPITDRDDFHTGVDIAAPHGTDILSALQGLVVEVGYSAVYGHTILLDHGGGVQTRYCHCDSIVARVGQQVAKGARIAVVGSTGLTTGPHLHFELIINGLRANPLPHLRTVAGL
jgi:murein DD-endopeptidase MepM/ murein hydrolase activator NlpD